MVEMAVIALIVGSVGLFVAGSVACYTFWHQRVASSLERVPVRVGRSVPVVSEGDDGNG
jgi:hypothetical protein